jgi:hypothetical protein
MKKEQQERAKSHDFKFFFNSWISIDDKKKPCKSIVKTREERGGVAPPVWNSILRLVSER